MFPFRAHCNIYILSRKKSVCDFLFVFVCLFCFVLFCVSFFKNSLVFFLTSATSVRLRERKEFEKQCFLTMFLPFHTSVVQLPLLVLLKSIIFKISFVFFVYSLI